jgi:hypothetical protein
MLKTGIELRVAVREHREHTMINLQSAEVADNGLVVITYSYRRTI